MGQEQKIYLSDREAEVANGAGADLDSVMGLMVSRENGRNRMANVTSSGCSRYCGSGPGPQLLLPSGACR